MSETKKPITAEELEKILSSKGYVHPETIKNNQHTTYLNENYVRNKTQTVPYTTVECECYLCSPEPCSCKKIDN